MKKFFNYTFSVIGITPLAIATVLPAATIGRAAQAHNALSIDYAISQEFSVPAPSRGEQTLIAAPIPDGDLHVFDFEALELNVKEIPKPEVKEEPKPEVDLVLEEQTINEDQLAPEEEVSEEPPAAPPSSSGLYTLGDLTFQGVINWEGLKFTYYSQSVLPGGGLSIPGRHVNSGGFVSDADGYIVLAGSAPMGTVYNTPFGSPGKIYDRGTVGNHLDVYTM